MGLLDKVVSSKDLEEAREVAMQIDVGKTCQVQGAVGSGCSRQEMEPSVARAEWARGRQQQMKTGRLGRGRSPCRSCRTLQRWKALWILPGVRQEAMGSLQQRGGLTGHIFWNDTRCYV